VVDVLSAHGLECVRNNQVLFSKLSFSVAPGEILHVVGANGSGKSSLLLVLTGMLLPQEGQVQWRQTPIESSSDYAAQLAYIGHRIGIKPNLTVLENLHLATALNNNQHQPGRQLTWEKALQRFNIAGLQHTLCEKLSAGQRQRVALSRLLMADAMLWILDEPFTAIDQSGVAQLQQLLYEHSARGGLVVLTSHQSLRLEGISIKRLELSISDELGSQYNYE
jgi:heme exporter protein A